MAHSEACQLFIEQQIKDGLEEGKSAYSIGKELTAMIERIFETTIPYRTLQDRALRMKKKSAGNPASPPTPSTSTEIQEKRAEQQNITTEENEGIPEKRVNQEVRDDKGKFVKVPGPGRSPKYRKERAKKDRPGRIRVYSDAMSFATIALAIFGNFPEKFSPPTSLSKNPGPGLFFPDHSKIGGKRARVRDSICRHPRGWGGSCQGRPLRSWGKGPGPLEAEGQYMK